MHYCVKTLIQLDNSKCRNKIGQLDTPPSVLHIQSRPVTIKNAGLIPNSQVIFYSIAHFIVVEENVGIKLNGTMPYPDSQLTDLVPIWI